MTSRTKPDSSHDPIGEFCLYLERVGRSQVTIMNYRSDIEGLVRWSEERNHKGLDLLYFVANDLNEYREFLIRKYKAATVNRKLATLKLYANWAIHADQLDSPELTRISNVKLTPKSRSAPNWLGHYDQTRLLRVVIEGGSVKDIAVITLLLNTGIRVSELCALRWSDVQMSDGRGSLTVYASKKYANRDVPLNEAARKALTSLGYASHVGMTENMFAGKSGSMTRRRIVRLFDRYCKLAGLKKTGGLEGLTPVALRHTFCMNLVSTGLDPNIVAMLMGHRTLEMTSIYYRNSDRQVARDIALKAVESLAG